MNPQSERFTWRTLVGFLLLAVLIAVVAVPTAVWLGSEQQPLVARLALALFASVVLFRLARVVREWAKVDEPSPADIAARPRATRVELDPILLRLSSELRFSLRFRLVPRALLERLRELFSRETGRIPPELGPGATVRPTWQDVEQAIENLEHSP